MTEVEKTLAVVCERVNALETVVIDEKRRLNGNLEKITNRLDSLNVMVGEYRVELVHAAARRPTWGVTVAITALASLSVGLLTLLAAR